MIFWIYTYIYIFSVYIYIKAISSYAVLHHKCFIEEGCYLFDNFVKHFNKIILKNIALRMKEKALCGICEKQIDSDASTPKATRIERIIQVRSNSKYNRQGLKGWRQISWSMRDMQGCAEGCTALDTPSNHTHRHAISLQLGSKYLPHHYLTWSSVDRRCHPETKAPIFKYCV